MDTVNHSMHGVLMAETLRLSCDIDSAIPIIIISAVVGAMPDILGWLEKLIKHDENAWTWYLKAHRLDHTNWFIYFPPSALHIWLDSFCHGENNRWWIWNEKLWMEVLSWIITITLFGVLYWKHLESILNLIMD